MEWSMQARCQSGLSARKCTHPARHSSYDNENATALFFSPDFTPDLTLTTAIWLNGFQMVEGFFLDRFECWQSHDLFYKLMKLRANQSNLFMFKELTTTMTNYIRSCKPRKITATTRHFKMHTTFIASFEKKMVQVLSILCSRSEPESFFW